MATNTERYLALCTMNNEAKTSIVRANPDLKKAKLDNQRGRSGLQKWICPRLPLTMQVRLWSEPSLHCTSNEGLRQQIALLFFFTISHYHHFENSIFFLVINQLVLILARWSQFLEKLRSCSCFWRWLRSRIAPAQLSKQALKLQLKSRWVSLRSSH